MSSTGVVAIFIPVVLSVANRMGILSYRLMMPLGFAGLISGMMTLVATPPNMVVNSELMRHNIHGFGFFGFTPMGVILGMGILYMLLMRTSLVRDKRRARAADRAHHARSHSRLPAGWPGAPVGDPARFTADRPDSGRAATAGPLRRQRHRGGALAQVSAGDGHRLRGDRVPGQDVLLIDMSDPEVDVREFCSEARLEPMILRGEYFSDQAREVGMAEVSLIPESRLLGKSIREWRFAPTTASTWWAFAALARRLAASWWTRRCNWGYPAGGGQLGLIRLLQTHSRDFLLLGLPVEVDEMAPARSQAIHALICLGVMIALMVTDPVPNVIAALIACLLMGKFRCIDMESAYKSIHWPTLILIVGMLPFALALQKTGGVDLIVGALISAVGDMGPRVMLASLFALCAIIGLFISNTATAVLMAPIALGTAQQMGISPIRSP